MEEFQPVLDLLWPTGFKQEIRYYWRFDDDFDEQCAKNMVRYLHSHDISTWEGLTVLGGLKLSFDSVFCGKKATREMLLDEVHQERERLQPKLETLQIICNYISLFGVEKFMAVLRHSQQQRDGGGNNNKKTNDGQPELLGDKEEQNVFYAFYAQRSMEQEIDSYVEGQDLENVVALDLSRSALKDLPMFVARLWMTRIFGDSYWTIFRCNKYNLATRDEWLALGALQLMQRYPVLASEEWPTHDQTTKQLPIYFFLKANYGKDILQKVFDLNPNGLEDAQGMDYWGILVGGKASLETILAMMQYCSPTNQPSRDESIAFLLQYLFEFGYDTRVIAPALAKFFPNESINKFYVQQWSGWNIDEERVQVIGKHLVPHLETLGCTIDSQLWEPDVFVSFLALFGDPKLITKLRSLKLLLPLPTIASTNKVRNAIKRFFVDKCKPLKRITLDASHYIDVDDDEDAGEPNIVKECNTAVRAIAHGIGAASKQVDWCLEELTLKSFKIDSSTSISMLFSFDMISTLVFGEQEYYQHPGLVQQPVKFSQWEELPTITGRDKLPIIQKMTLVGVDLSDKAWYATWKQISKSEKIERITLDPEGWLKDPPKRILTALNALSFSKSLKALTLLSYALITEDGNNEYDQLDITERVAKLIQDGCLEFFHVLLIRPEWVEAEGDDMDLTGPYKINMNRICEALKFNRTLKCLWLHGVDVEGTNITRSITETLEATNNTTLESIQIFDDLDRMHTRSHAFGPFQRFCTEADNTFYNDWKFVGYYTDRTKLYYKTNLNALGLGKLRKEGTTTVDLIDLLVDVEDQFGVSEREFENEIIAMALQPMDNLSELYMKLHGSPFSWCKVLEQQTEVVGYLYGLLRDSTDLWCQRTESITSCDGSSPLAKRRRLDESHR